jgi:large subunit ribosomal protein L4
VHVVSGLVAGDAPATKAAAAALSRISPRRNVLLVLEREDELTWKSVRNLPEVHVLVADQLNTYDVLCADDVVFTRGALDAFVAGPARGKGATAVATAGDEEVAP